MKTVDDGCEEENKARMVVTLEIDKTYLLFVGSYEETLSTITLDLSITCPGDCQHGICSQTAGQYVCEEGYILTPDGICSTCGNGKIDKDEECDSSVEGQEDMNCNIGCMCQYGYQPMIINGIQKCAPATCGNNQIDPYEQCDGGHGCDHCMCVNGTKKYAKARIDCIPSTCGNNRIDAGEECDGGANCVECECQEGSFTHHKTDCMPFRSSVTPLIFLGGGYAVYLLFWCVLFIILFVLFVIVTQRIKQELQLDSTFILENVIIPFDNKHSQYLNLRLENDYCTFEPCIVDFNKEKLEINEAKSTEISITNKWKETTCS